MKKRRGLASAPLETRIFVAKKGGDAVHAKRGLQAASKETRAIVARAGGLARGTQRRKKKEEEKTGLLASGTSS